MTSSPISMTRPTPETLPEAKPQGQTLCDKVWDAVCFIFSPFVALYNCIAPINPVTKSREIQLIPSCVERWLGKVAYPGLVARSGGEIFATDTAYGAYATMVQEVGAELAAKCPRQDLQFEFKLLHSFEDNAWCLPGGKIGINLGLIQKMDRDGTDYGLGFNPTLREKVAAVLSHEITHAAARHGGRKVEFSLFLFVAITAVKYAFSYFVRRSYDEQIEAAKNDPGKQDQLRHLQSQSVQNCLKILDPLSSWVSGGLGLCGSRRHELEADKYGMYLFAELKEGEFNKNSPKAAIWLMHFFTKHHSTKTHSSCFNWVSELFHTHPSPEERLAANIVTWNELNKI